MLLPVQGVAVHMPVVHTHTCAVDTHCVDTQAVAVGQGCTCWPGGP